MSVFDILSLGHRVNRRHVHSHHGSGDRTGSLSSGRCVLQSHAETPCQERGTVPNPSRKYRRLSYPLRLSGNDTRNIRQCTCSCKRSRRRHQT